MNKFSYCRVPYWLVLLSVFLVVSSCTKDSMPKLVLEEKESSNPYRISEQEALASLQDFLNSPTGYSQSPTKSSAKDKLRGKRIGKVNYLTTSSSFRTFLSNKTAHSLRTKIHEIDPGGPRPDSIIIPDTLVYVVNFDDDGFAVLSADNRISSTIIAVVESGSISIENFNLNDHLEQMFSDTTLTYDMHWGEDEDGDDICLEYTISTAMYEQMFSPDSTTFLHTPQEMIIEMVSDYLVNEVVNNFPSSPGNGIDPGEIWENPETGQSGQEGGEPSSGSGNMITCEWETVSEVPAMITTKWFQEAPLSQFTPLKSNGLEHKDIGCGPVAVAQILAYHEYPSYYFLNGYYCNWGLIKSVFVNHEDNYPVDFPAVVLLSHILEELRKETKRSFFLEWYSGSWTTAKRCKKAFKSAGYTGVHRHIGYHGNTVLNMLDSGNPVFIGAIDRSSLEGHFWVLDGYRIQNLVGSNGNTYGSRTLLHCNFGWKGSYDGYYYSGVFEIGSGPEYNQYPDSNPDLIGNHYNWWYRMITYDNPNS